MRRTERTISPFRDGDASATLRHLTATVVDEIQSLENEYVLKASPTELEQFYLEKVRVHPLTLATSDLYIENHQGVNLDVTGDFRRFHYPDQPTIVRGTRLTIVIPFDGDPQLWHLRASTFSLSGYPDITVRDTAISFNIEFPDDTANEQRVRERIDSEAKALADAVQYLRNDIDTHNRSAPDEIKRALARKRQKAESALGVIARLGLPVRPKQVPPAFVAPVQRRKTPVKQPVVAPGKYEPEPFLEEAEYEHILKVLKSMSLVMERDPSAFSTLDEENIRTHFLIQLNGHYESQATGETFNKSGKTDILIRSGDRNVFIAECKFWRGPKVFDETIDQLLSYLTWRDTKSAILVFNTNKDSSSVRTKMHEAMQARAEYRRTVFHHPDGDSRYILVKASEPGREIIVTTQLYDVPAKK